MQGYPLPTGKAGIQQILAIEESIHSQIEQMFRFSAKRRSLKYLMNVSSAEFRPSEKMRIDARLRECDGGVNVCAGRALELSLQLIYALGTDHILGREYPGVSGKKIKKERQNHNLSDLYKKVIKDIETDGIGDAIENIYQLTVHKGMSDILVDDNFVTTQTFGIESAFRETTNARFLDGAEHTRDHAHESSNLNFPFESKSGFLKKPENTFVEFLNKADQVYYASDVTDEEKRGNLQLERYSARDHEYGRPYIVIGTNFFSRLVENLIKISQQQWFWHAKLLERWCCRHLYQVKQNVDALLKQNYLEVPELPEMISVEDTMKRLRQRFPAIDSLTHEQLKNFHNPLRFYTHSN